MTKIKKKTVKKITKKKGLNSYLLSLNLNGKEYKTENNDLKEALLSIHPEFYKTRGFLTVKKGDKEAKRIFNIPQMKRLFGFGGTNTQKIAVECTAKLIKLLLGEK